MNNSNYNFELLNNTNQPQLQYSLLNKNNNYYQPFPTPDYIIPSSYKANLLGYGNSYKNNDYSYSSQSTSAYPCSHDRCLNIDLEIENKQLYDKNITLNSEINLVKALNDDLKKQISELSELKYLNSNNQSNYGALVNENKMLKEEIRHLEYNNTHFCCYDYVDELDTHCTCGYHNKTARRDLLGGVSKDFDRFDYQSKIGNNYDNNSLNKMTNTNMNKMRSFDFSNNSAINKNDSSVDKLKEGVKELVDIISELLNKNKDNEGINKYCHNCKTQISNGNTNLQNTTKPNTFNSSNNNNKFILPEFDYNNIDNLLSQIKTLKTKIKNSSSPSNSNPNNIKSNITNPLYKNINNNNFNDNRNNSVKDINEIPQPKENFDIPLQDEEAQEVAFHLTNESKVKDESCISEPMLIEGDSIKDIPEKVNNESNKNIGMSGNSNNSLNSKLKNLNSQDLKDNLKLITESLKRFNKDRLMETIKKNKEKMMNNKETENKESKENPNSKSISSGSNTNKTSREDSRKNKSNGNVVFAPNTKKSKNNSMTKTKRKDSVSSKKSKGLSNKEVVLVDRLTSHKDCPHNYEYFYGNKFPEKKESYQN